MQAIINQLVSRLTEHLSHLPAHLMIEGVKHFQEKKQKKIDANVTSLATFLDAVEGHRDEEALSLCTSELQAVITTEGAKTALDEVRQHLSITASEVFAGPLDFKFAWNNCRVSGVINYTGNRSARFFVDTVLQQDQWEIRGYSFESVPALPATTAAMTVASPAAKKNKRTYRLGVAPTKEGDCPKRNPIKGSSRNIYHLPTGQFYVSTCAVRCFATEAEAKAAGFRPTLR